MTDYVKGLDVSSIQGVIDWPSVVAAGYRFIIHRCYVGNGYKDPLYDKNIAGAKAAGLKVACYSFAYPLPTIPSQPTRDPKVQAKIHVDAAGKDIPVHCLDLEWPAPQNWARWSCTAPQIVQWTIDYLEEYERLSGVRPVVYLYPYFATAINLPASFAEKYKLWIASYTTTPVIPKPWTEWTLWQRSGGSEKLPNGVDVDVDCAKDLALWDVPVPIVAPPPPPVIEPPTPVSPVPPIPPVSSPPQPSIINTIGQTILDFWTKLLK